jgi:hypothetical protein
MTFVSRWGFSAAILLAATSAAAAEDDDAAEKPFARLEIAPTTGALIMHRASSAGGQGAAGWSFGGALRGYRGIHGVMLAYTGVATEMTTTFFGNGPATHYIEPAYSVRLGDSRSLGEKVGLSLVLDLGPSLAFVERTMRSDDLGAHSFVDVPSHATFGFRTSLNLALHVWRGFLGLDVGYRGGLPIDAATARWEGAFITQASLGMEIDVPTMPRR